MNYIQIKNILDKIFAIIVLIISSPILLLCIISIIIEEPSHSPIFVQRRIGFKNKEFTIYKLRTMKTKKKEKERKLTDKERLLKTGKIFRKASLDELPQLFNIIKGEMSFIGPRPLSIKYLPYYNEMEIKRHNVKPGITGWAQVNGRNNLNWEEKFKYDIEYVNNISFLLDLKIAFLTIYKIFKSDEVQVRGDKSGEEDFHEYRKKQSSKNE